jgi:hypothetical protein
VASPQLVAAVTVLVPAMALVWFYLRRYEGYFEQNRLFFALLVGLFAGTLIRFAEVFLFSFDNPRVYQPTGELTTGTLVYSFAYTTLGLAALESLGKTAVLGFKKFRTRKDTAYYGAALGIGFGAMWVMQIVASLLVQSEGQVSLEQVPLIYDFFLLVLAFGLLATQAASAVWIGRGAGEGKLWKGALHGTLWLAPALALYWAFLHAGDQVYTALGALGWGIFAMMYADKRVLQVIVPPEIRDMVRKERRRKARAK